MNNSSVSSSLPQARAVREFAEGGGWPPRLSPIVQAVDMRGTSAITNDRFGIEFKNRALPGPNPKERNYDRKH